jgi:hypothetical protein
MKDALGHGSNPRGGPDMAHQTGVNQVPAGIASHPDVIRAQAAANAVRAVGGSAMDAALAAVHTGFDQTAANRSQAERAALYRKVTGR